MKRCNSCGGVIGQDCFDPDECDWIAHQQEQTRQLEVTITLESLAHRVEQLEQALAALQLARGK